MGASSLRPKGNSIHLFDPPINPSNPMPNKYSTVVQGSLDQPQLKSVRELQEDHKKLTDRIKKINTRIDDLESASKVTAVEIVCQGLGYLQGDRMGSAVKRTGPRLLFVKSAACRNSFFRALKGTSAHPFHRGSRRTYAWPSPWVS